MPEPTTLAEAKARGPVERSDWHVVRELSRKNIERIKAAKAGETWTQIPEYLRPACHRDGYIGFTNVYGRMEWDRPSPTITGGCTTFSKGRFGHPEADRTISVREAALLQTFPLDYRLDTPYMDLCLQHDRQRVTVQLRRSPVAAVCRATSEAVR